MREDDSNNGLLWFLTGLGLGAVIGVLYAPKSGAETRRALAEGAEQGREYLSQRGTEAREHVSQFVDRGRDVLNRQREQLNSALEAGRQAYRDAVTGSGSGSTGSGSGSSNS